MCRGRATQRLLLPMREELNVDCLELLRLAVRRWSEGLAQLADLQLADFYRSLEGEGSRLDRQQR